MSCGDLSGIAVATQTTTFTARGALVISYSDDAYLNGITPPITLAGDPLPVPNRFNTFAVGVGDMLAASTATDVSLNCNYSFMSQE